MSSGTEAATGAGSSNEDHDKKDLGAGVSILVVGSEPEVGVGTPIDKIGFDEAGVECSSKDSPRDREDGKHGRE